MNPIVVGWTWVPYSKVRDLDLAQVETEECSLVTVLASDGYTCITSPVISNRSITIHEVSEASDKDGGSGGVSPVGKKVVQHCNGGTDSGLSSEEGSSDNARWAKISIFGALKFAKI